MAAPATPSQLSLLVNGHRLETARTHWQYGSWEDIAMLDTAEIATDQDRAKLMALVAGAQASLGEMTAARASTRQALAWGCDRSILSRILISAVYNSLAVTALGLEEVETARRHFRKAIDQVEPRAEAGLLARTREIRQAARAGLLPDAIMALDDTLKQVQARPEEVNASLGILQEEMALLRHELALSLKRRQIYHAKEAPAHHHPDPADLESRSVSQLGQDLWVLERTAHKRGGFFVEFGATDGVSLSNTLLLEKEFGWNGICAEPNPTFFAQLQENRTCIVSDACIGSRTGDEVEFLLADAYGGFLANVDCDHNAERRAPYLKAGRITRLRTISLNDFLLEHDAPRDIDYLSIDTEGSEYDILSAFPFDRWRIRLLTVEHNFTPMREQVCALLEGHGYKRTQAEWDDWYELAT